ncbi:polyphenol oxidase family protein [Desulfonatronum thiodismutans]|uniref:polyphenol oxidase family protein n=1 Tax=Desulfonatronum thiodismutans TaxID=159290 RepID=UPI0004ABE4A3|nr:polyphenol oxidase family protein [Desulfonatronum thiodismutans]
MTIIPFSFPGLPNIKAAFTTRLGGVSQEPRAEANLSWEVGDEDARVLANRRILQRRLGFDHWFETRQVHGVEMVIDPGPPKTGPKAGPGAGTGTETGTDDVSLRPTLEADGSATSRPGLALIVKTADCQPILLAHRDGGHVAALHCGWRGNRQGFPQKGVAAFCEAYNLRPEDVLAVRGPSLGPGASEFVNFDLEWGDDFRDYFDPAAKTVDLWRLTRDQLLAAGLRPDHIFGLDLCTANLPETFFSYRRDKVTGRQVGLIWIA